MGYSLQPDIRRSSGPSKPHTRLRQVSEAGLRYYNPGLGRWISRDPIGEKGSLHLFCFVQNSPVNLVDSFGAWPWGPDYRVRNSDGTVSTKVKKCNVVIYVGHNSTVPQGTVRNESCSAASVVACGGDAGRGGSHPGTPETPIPGAPAQHTDYDEITYREAKKEARKAFEAGVKYAQDTICKDPKQCCKKVEVQISCDFGFDPMANVDFRFAELGTFCGKSQTVNCGGQ